MLYKLVNGVNNDEIVRSQTDSMGRGLLYRFGGFLDRSTSFFAPEQPVSTSIALNEPQPPQAGNSQKPVDRPAPAPLSQRIVEYHIGAALEAGTKTIQGQQTMTWTNPGAQPVGELYFHLYPNAFKSKDSTFMQESGGKLRKDRMKEGSYGQMDILSMKTAQGESLKDRIEYVQPDDGNKKGHDTDQTYPAQSRQSRRKKITLHTDFTVKLPAVFCADGVFGRFCHGRPVVPQNRRLRNERHSRTVGRRLESPPVPRQFGILCGFWHL